MNISQRNMNNEEILKIAKIFLDEEDFRYLNYFFEMEYEKIIIYSKERNVYIITGDVSELEMIYNHLKKIDLDNKFKDLIHFLNALNNTYIYLLKNYYFDSLIINKYINMYNLSNNILDNIYILENNQLRKITEKEFQNNHYKIYFDEYRHNLGEDFFIILNENFDIITASTFSSLKTKTEIKCPYCFFYGFDGLSVADMMVVSKLNFLKPIPDSNFFYEKEKNKLIIYKYVNNNIEYFAEIKIKENYEAITLEYIDNKIKLTFKTRNQTESNIEFYLILETKKIKSLLLIFKRKLNKTSDSVMIYVIGEGEKNFRSEPSEYSSRSWYSIKTNYIVKDDVGFLIEKNLEYMYFNGKKIKLINNYNCNLKNITELFLFLNNGFVLDDYFITYNGEILPIKSFISDKTLILSIIKNKVNKGIYFDLKNLEYDFKKDIFKLKTLRIDKNIEGYKSKLNKEILKEFINL